jgi:hypothetical protein
MELGFLDLLVVGGQFDPFTAMGKDLVERGHALEIPVYLCLSGSDLLRRGRAHSDLSVGNADAWRGAASNCWHVGADGIMTFNLFSDDLESREQARQIWRDIADPEALSLKDKLYCVENIGYTHDYCFQTGQSVLTNPLPVTVRRGGAAQLTMLVGDNIRCRKDRLKSLRLRIGLSPKQEENAVTVRLNGRPIVTKPDRTPWLVGSVPPDLVIQGDNSIQIKHRDGPSEAVTVDGLELTVRYKS